MDISVITVIDKLQSRKEALVTDISNTKKMMVVLKDAIIRDVEPFLEADAKDRETLDLVYTLQTTFGNYRKEKDKIKEFKKELDFINDILEVT